MTNPLFRPTAAQVADSQLASFMASCGFGITEYREFMQYCREEYREFWQLLLTWTEVPVEGDATVVCRGDKCETAEFFPDLRLNYAEVLLRRNPTASALIACHRDRPSQRYTRGELTDAVISTAHQLHHVGVMPGDRVVAIARNNAEVVIAALATASIGAVFSSCATDMGVRSILSRFEQLAPVILFANLRHEAWDGGEPLDQRIAAISAALPTLRALIALDDGHCDSAVPMYRLTAWLNPLPAVEDWKWRRFPFNTPLFILFSSGTTGVPKCIIHGAGGTLIEHLKEHRLHGDMSSDDRLYFQTNAGWMMWNWQLSALASGVELVLYDGPMDGPETLWRLLAEQQVTVFGTNPAFLQFCQTASFVPRQSCDLGNLRSVLSTGSILYPHQFDWIMQEVKPLLIQSISGGSDIIGCFVLGNPILPVYRGEAQCSSLGLDVRAIDGELVCGNPFPSRPLGFFRDDGTRFHAAYFSQNPGVWTHGDLIEFTAHDGAILHGRSDGVLIIRGVRIGPAEIYRLLQDIPMILEAMAVEQTAPLEPGGSRLILLVVLRRSLDMALIARIKDHLMTHGTAVMVPARIIQIDALPVTHNGKRSEAAARDAVNGQPIRNREALLNPECLDQIQTPAPPLIATMRAEESLEAWLQRTCETLLGMAPINWTANLLRFGDSVTIMNLYLELGKAIGRPLPWLTTTPSIVKLAAIIRDEQMLMDEGSAIVRPANYNDCNPVCDLLQRAFPHIPATQWRRLFHCPWSVSPPTYGFVLETNDTIVGFVGALYADRTINGQRATICNLTSWYVEPAYRGWGAALISMALANDPSLTYTALTPAPLAHQILTNLKFITSNPSSLLLLPLGNPTTLRRRPIISFVLNEIRPHLTDDERQIFDDHLATDCLHVLVRVAERHAYLVVKRRCYQVHRWCPKVAASRVLYCSDTDLMTEYLERIKLAILWRQRTVMLIMASQTFRQPPRGWTRRTPILVRSTLFQPDELDMLYSEVCLLPV